MGSVAFRQSLIEKLFYDQLFGRLDVKTVLEVGSGNGKMIDYFTRRGKKITGIDLHPTRSDVTKMDFLKNKFPDNYFDLVYSAHVIEHIPDAETFVSELVRVSKRYVCVMAPLPVKSFWDQPDHLRPYTKETFKRVFRLNSWIKCFEVNLPFFEPVAIVLFDKSDSRMA